MTYTFILFDRLMVKKLFDGSATGTGEDREGN
jgi:hypothetical protein